FEDEDEDEDEDKIKGLIWEEDVWSMCGKDEITCWVMMMHPPPQLEGLPFELKRDLLPNCTIGSSNSFEWRKIIFRMITSMGIHYAKTLTLRGEAFDETRAKVIQDLAILKSPQELFDPFEA
ncbi:hypothetical protein Tco_0455975, partial [Tanacetum coccineum]